MLPFKNTDNNKGVLGYFNKAIYGYSKGKDEVWLIE